MNSSDSSNSSQVTIQGVSQDSLNYLDICNNGLIVPGTCIIDLKQSNDLIIADFYKNCGLNSLLDLTSVPDEIFTELLGFFSFTIHDRTIKMVSLDNIDVRTLRNVIIPEIIKSKCLSLYDFIVNSVKKDDYYNVTLSHLQRYDIVFRQRDLFKADIWYTRDFQVEDSRRSPDHCEIFTFGTIKNPMNKNYVKMYIKYRVLGSSVNIDHTIASELFHLKRFCELLGDVSFIEATRNDMENVLSRLHEEKKNCSHNYKSAIMSAGWMILDYLEYLEIIPQNPLADDLLLHRREKFVVKDVEDQVIETICRNLFKLPVIDRDIYYVILSTGLRMEDACSLTKENLLSKDIENGETVYYLNYYCHKLYKWAKVNIPESLYKKLNALLDAEKERESKYLFERITNNLRPYDPGTFKSHLSALCKELNLKNTDGSKYIFAPHAYRHKLLAELSNIGVPLFTIAIVAAHANLGMTLHYINYDGKKMVIDEKDFLDKNGMTIKVNLGENITGESDEEFLRTHIEYKRVPCGLCNRSDMLRECEQIDGDCFLCSFFVTSKYFLPDLRESLRLTKLDLAMVNADPKLANPNRIATYEKQIENYTRLISIAEHK